DGGLLAGLLLPLVVDVVQGVLEAGGGKDERAAVLRHRYRRGELEAQGGDGRQGKELKLVHWRSPESIYLQEYIEGVTAAKGIPLWRKPLFHLIVRPLFRR